MHLRTTLVAGAAFLVLAPAADAAQTASAELLDIDGVEVGTVGLRQTPNGVLLTVVGANMPPGVHAFHIHETGQCDAATGFKSSGGHYAPGGHMHGYLVEGGPHAGDLPNIHVLDDGKIEVEYMTALVSLEDGADATLFDADGSAIVIHEGVDDYQSQPSGAAGDRIACGIIEPSS